MPPLARFEATSVGELFEDIEIDIWPAPLASPPMPPDQHCHRSGRDGSGLGCSCYGDPHRDAAATGFSPCGGGGGVALRNIPQAKEQHHAAVPGPELVTPAGVPPAPSVATAASGGVSQRGGAVPSRGSQEHWGGGCVPCKYLRSKRGCIKGESCELCHLLHSEVGYTGARRMMRASAERRGAPRPQSAARRPPQDTRAAAARCDMSGGLSEPSPKPRMGALAGAARALAEHRRL
eukprot:CAMPEP_0176246248 /NCGR_PEP_ID=MMETSP0121_2-20121125/32351_1 /TAXON_ID=160619 /ORGANISM="Kryptoperidinium foliaceum, Strain CCMP 1326" /LENGTH=234 /DNA_ID=CAMNT_0017585885 /DNA_START=1 /DNA_END=703 /DNA_ORIENTATION=+